MLNPNQVQETLTKLSYWDGPIDGNLSVPAFRNALKKFQSDMGLSSDGWYGDKSDGELSPLFTAIQSPPSGFTVARRWRLTQYWIADENDYKADAKVPVYDKNKNVLCQVGASFFANMSLEGTGKTSDGILLNVSGDYVTVDSGDYQPVLDVAKKILSAHPGYAGIVISGDKVAKAFAFEKVSSQKVALGYGTQRGIPMQPFKTVAADLGAYSKCDPRFKAAGGLVPAGTQAWIPLMVGMKLPDGTVHDGFVTVNDTGSAIFGSHFDIFSGTGGMRRSFHHHSVDHVWFEGIEGRVSMDYSLGLVS